MDFVFVTLAFVGGCIFWNYYGDRVKGWLHGKEREVGDKIKGKL